MNILIADDERLVRVGLESMLCELYPEQNTITQVKDGEEMIKLVSLQFFDIVFLDINMPKKNGLDALEICAHHSPETKWCILTGYADFQYARRSIALGVKGYLLKPPDIEELKKLVDEIIMEQKEIKRQRREKFENQIVQTFYMVDTVGVMKSLPPLENGKQFFLYLFLLDTAKVGSRKTIYASLYRDLGVYLEHHISGGDRYALFFLQSSELCLLVEGKEYDRLNSYLWRSGENIAAGEKLTAFSTSAFGFDELYTNKQLLMGLAPIRMLYKNLQTVSLDSLCKQEYLVEKRFLCEKIESLTAEIKTGNYSDATILLQEMERNKMDRHRYNSLINDDFFNHISLIWQFPVIRDSYENVILQFKSFLQKCIVERKEIKGDLVGRIIDYVSINYSEDVTIENLGALFDITPSYLSRIFREKSGEKYIDFLTKLRMNKARDLLLDDRNLSIKEIAQRVGYSGEKHFSRIFKKYFDCLPSQYLAMMMRISEQN